MYTCVADVRYVTVIRLFRSARVEYTSRKQRRSRGTNFRKAKKPKKSSIRNIIADDYCYYGDTAPYYDRNIALA